MYNKQKRKEPVIEVERLFRVTSIVDIFDTEADSRDQRFLKKERNTNEEIDFGKIFKSACDDLKSTG